MLTLGDNFDSDRYPVIDSNSGGDLDGLISNIRRGIKIAKKAERNTGRQVTIVAGHGPAQPLDDLKEYLDMLKGSRAVIEEGINMGKTLETLLAEGLPQYTPKFAWFIVPESRWIVTLWNEILK